MMSPWQPHPYHVHEASQELKNGWYAASKTVKKSWQIADQESIKQVVNAGAKTLDTKTVGIGYITADNSEDHAHSYCRLLIAFKILWA